MKKIVFLLLSAVFTANNLVAEDLPKDTIRLVDIEDVIIIASPKENKKMRQLPSSVTLLSQQDMQAYQVNSLKNLTAIVPNIFIPDYGSKLTSAIYIRGIGSRINTPSVGLYVDNVPYIDKSAFDFNYSDIERIDVLRGPQGTLYGRNAMSGLIRVSTKSPFSYQGTDIKLGVGTHGKANASLTHYHRISDRFAFSAGGFYEYADGFFKNAYKDNKKIDRVNAGGGRIRGIYLPSDDLKLDLNVSYEYSDQGGYAYGQYDKETGKLHQPSFNEDNSYYRGLFNSSLNLEYQANKFIISSVTGFQNLNDRMFIDQDFTPVDIFTLTQRQKLQTLSEEIVLKSKPMSNWQWTTGVFGSYQWLKTDGPVTFKETGVSTMIEGNVNSVFEKLSAENPRMPSMNLEVKQPQLPISNIFKTPVMNTAVYHQSTYNNLFVDGLSFTAGLRLDYEKMHMDYYSATNLSFDFLINTSTMEIPLNNLEAISKIEGKEKNDYLELLPKFALKYDFDSRNNIYVSVSKGYRSGGYNIQMFSDLVQSDLRNEMLESIISNAGTMQSMVEGLIVENVDWFRKTTDVKETTIYKPEYSWNYEIGSHLTLFDNRFQADVTAFYMDTYDQQVSRFAENGLGRMTINAGRSRSIGSELSVRANIGKNVLLSTSYGYTDAKFKTYLTDEKNDNDEVVEIDYSNNYVPFVPKHTLSVNGQYTWSFVQNKKIQSLTANLGYTGAGKIYWTEANDVSQSFYGTVNARLSVLAGSVQVDLWGQNIFDKKYTCFYFESMKKGFMQQSRPSQFGVDIRLRF